MDEKEQAAGERRVQEMLIKPLLKLGLGKPGHLRISPFEEMLKDMRQKLAYMSEDGLRDLREWCECHPGGKERDRFPIALKVLEQARRIEAPETGPSPLMLKVFASQTGREAIEKGYAPELLAHLKAVREWPGAYTLSLIKKKADDPVRRLEDVELRLSRGDAVPVDDVSFRDQRLASLRKCQDIADRGAVAAE